jgi:hypothetical protein
MNSLVGGNEDHQQTLKIKQQTKTKASTTFSCCAKSGDQPKECLAKYLWSQNK